MSITGRRLVRLQLLLLAIPSGLLAQSGAPLSMPAQNVGTCMPVPGAILDTTKMRSHRLIMKSLSPASRREMSAMIDLRGRVTAYTEMTFESTGPGRSKGSTVIATFDSTRMVLGFRTDNEIAYPDSALRDVEGLVHGRYEPATEMTRRELDDSAQRTIRDLIAFLRKRCPA